MNRLPAKLLSVTLLFICIDLKAQQPILKVGSKDSLNVSLTTLKTEVKVIGNYAVTTMEMEFCNTAPRVLEGELIFPMPEGVTVSRYAIDINGRMREAVPVEKEKGQVVFESIVRRRVDPGLLEKVQGNNFRTRIYPIPANGCRRVIIGYEQLLGATANYSFLYSLPLHFTQPLKQFDFSITVASNYIPEVGSDCNTHLKFEELNKVFTSSVSEKNYTPDGAFNIIIPKTADAAEVSMQEVKGQYYFLINTFPAVKKIEKKIPDAITIIWDASLSGRKRDHKKEFELLDAYIKAAGRLTVHLYQSGIDCRKINDYSVSPGNWSNLKKSLEDMIYDGATDLSAIKYPPGEEYLVFTDGLNTFGNSDNMMLPQKPVYTICASATADHSMLKYIAQKTGGAFINLNELDIAAAQKYLTEQTLQFIGIKPNGDITDVYPSVATPVGGNCSIAGISHSGNQSITLQFGYGTTVAAEQQIDMNINFQKTNFINIEKIWAQKKIAELDIQYEKNKDAISEMGKKYSVITRNSSLIVLDQVEDYVQYEIEPPAELMGAYTSLMNEKKASAVKEKKYALTESLNYFRDLADWWSLNFTKAYLVYPPKKNKESEPTIKAETTVVPFLRIGETQEQVANESVKTDELKEPIPPPPPPPPPVEKIASNVMADPTGDADHDGVANGEDKCPNEPGPSSNFGCPVIPEEIIQKVNLSAVNVFFASGSAKLDSSYNSAPRSAMRDNDGVFDSNYDENEDRTWKVYDKQRPNYPWNITKTPAHITVKEVKPGRPYLDELNKVSKEDRYDKYLALREKNNEPTFYLDVANMFFHQGDTTTGYRVLTNIAELNLDDHESCKMLGYRLKSLKKYDEEVMLFRKVLRLRPQDPQSYRDYALALADAGKYQQALDTLYLALNKNFDKGIMDLYTGIEEIIITEINEIIAQHRGQVNTSGISKDIIKPLPVDVRIVLNWNMNDTDIDLWVIDPNGEKCYYSHRQTKVGGIISLDFTRGFGPEQFMLKKSIKGKYKVIANYFGDSRQRIAGNTTVMAEIYTYYGTPKEQKQVVTFQLQGKESDEVLVGEFSF